MTYRISKTANVTTEKNGKKFKKEHEKDFFLGKFKENFIFSLNSGNFYVTLQLEMCPFGS